MKQYVLSCLFLWLFIASKSALFAQPITSNEVDMLVERSMKTFHVPGIAVVIIKDDKVIHSKGYGVRSLQTNQKVDENTLFGIASNSKAFTTAALGILVDQGKLKWDDKVTDYIPEFKMYDPYVTQEFTIRDLLTHRSGLGLGAGDLMFWPGTNDFTLKDIIYNLRFLKPVSGFRSKFDYDNLLYVVAGEVIARLSGKSWEEFIETQIMNPLGMTGSAASFSRIKDKSNVIDPHAPVNGKVQVVPRDFTEITNAAGGIYSNITDLSKWVRMQLNNGKFGDGPDKRIFSDNVHEEMWTPQTILPVRGPSVYNTHFGGYGLGWFLSDVKGFKQVMHTGGLSGMVTQVTMIPELKLGIVVLTNQQEDGAFSSITNTIKDSYLDVKGIDRVKQYAESNSASRTNAGKVISDVENVLAERMKLGFSELDKSIYTGTYRDKWFGNIIISVKDGKLWFDSKRSPRLTGQMFPYKGNTFVVKWVERSLDADAFVMFGLDTTGKAAQMKMKAISPLTDFSFDFQDLDFQKIEK
jgi:CubicO group peptidase (beta-lactamase class C family)